MVLLRVTTPQAGHIQTIGIVAVECVVRAGYGDSHRRDCGARGCVYVAYIAVIEISADAAWKASAAITVGRSAVERDGAQAEHNQTIVIVIAEYVRAGYVDSLGCDCGACVLAIIEPTVIQVNTVASKASVAIGSGCGTVERDRAVGQDVQAVQPVVLELVGAQNAYAFRRCGAIVVFHKCTIAIRIGWVLDCAIGIGDDASECDRSIAKHIEAVKPVTAECIRGGIVYGNTCPAPW